MNRIIAFLLLASLVISFASCGNNGEAGVTSDNEITEPISVTTTEPVTEPVAPIAPTFTVTELKTSITSSKSSFKLFRYPVVTVDGNEKLAERINMQILASCEKFFKRCVPGATALVRDGAEIEFEITECKVRMFDNRLLSVAFYSKLELFGIDGDEMPDKAFYSTNIDLTTGEEISGSRLIKDLDKLKELLTSDSVIIVSEMVDTSASVISEALLQYRADYGIYPYVFFDGDGVIVCVELAKLQGGYVLFKITASTAADHFNEVIYDN